MKKPKNHPLPIRIAVVKGKPTVIKDKLVIIKPVYYN